MIDLRFVKIDENDLGEIWINIQNIAYIKDLHLESNNPHISYEIGMNGGTIFRTYHDIPEIKTYFIIS